MTPVPARRRAPLSVAPTLPESEPDLAIEHKAAVVAALRWAWSELSRTAPELIRAGDEENVTASLQDLLNERKAGQRVASWLVDFESVTRGESQRTADARVGKKPDLTFRPVPYQSVRNATRWGWFVECKIVDGQPSLVAYREKGIKRFTTGEYAAWMCSGAMVGYVRDGSTPGVALKSAVGSSVALKRFTAGTISDQSETEHDRSRLQIPCVDVTIHHLWLLVP